MKYAEGHSDIAGFREYPKDLDEEMVKGGASRWRSSRVPIRAASGDKGLLVSYGGFVGIEHQFDGVRLVDAWSRWLVRSCG